MRIDRAPILTLFVVAIYTPTAFAGESVVIAAKETEVLVAPRATQSRLVNLPAIEFGLRASIRCSGDAESLTLSIADAFTTLGPDAIADERSVEAEVTVPARQVALAEVTNFCLSGDATSRDELTVPGLTTAHASLRCRNGDQLSTQFASAPLQIRLVCDRPSDEDQDPSPDR